MRTRAHGRGGFTLLEVMGVILVTALVLGFATDYYIDLSRATSRASENLRDIRHATAILDRVARDFEGTFLIVKPPEVDPLEHPWLFFAESQVSESGADHIKFITRNFIPRRSDAHESDHSLIAYTLHPSEFDDTYELYRWSSPQLPESLDRSFPARDDEGSVLLAERLLDFGVRFYGRLESTDGAGNLDPGSALGVGLGPIAEPVESDSWDSTTLLGSGTLPEAVEITVAIAPEDFDEFDDPDEVPRYRRTVRLPMRPVDLAAMLSPDNEEADEDEVNGEPDEDSGDLTMGDCFNFDAVSQDPAYTAFAAYADAQRHLPWADARALIPSELLVYVYAEPECQ